MFNYYVGNTEFVLKMMAHYWENWISSSELSEKLKLSKRRTNQILKFYFGLGLIEMSIQVKYPDDKLVSKVFTWSTYARPVYKCKYSKGFEHDNKEE